MKTTKTETLSSPGRRSLATNLLHFSLWASALALPGFARANSAKILVLGDSLSAEYGLARGTGWVALLAQRLKEQKPSYTVQNASISGDTTAGGRARLPTLLKAHQPAIVIIELGANDALRGLPLASTRENLAVMTRAAKAGGAKVLLAGMQVPPNYGASYGREFAALFGEVAKAEKTALLPFLLSAIADRPDALDWFQSDRIHPLAKAHPQMLDNVWGPLKPMLR